MTKGKLTQAEQKRVETADVRTGFTIHSSISSSIVGMFDEEGWFILEQDGNQIAVPPAAIHRFRRAVTELHDVQSM